MQQSQPLNIRPELRFPNLDESKVQQLEELANEIFDRHDSGNSYQDLLQQFNHETGGNYEWLDFHGAESGMGVLEFVKITLLPEPPFIPDITDEELITIITYLLTAPPDGENYWYESILNLHIMNPRMWENIPPDTTPEEILRIMRSYQPLITPSL